MPQALGVLILADQRRNRPLLPPSTHGGLPDAARGRHSIPLFGPTGPTCFWIVASISSVRTTTTHSELYWALPAGPLTPLSRRHAHECPTLNATSATAGGRSSSRLKG